MKGKKMSIEKAKELASKLSNKLAGKVELNKEFDMCLDLMMELENLESKIVLEKSKLDKDVEELEKLDYDDDIMAMVEDLWKKQCEVIDKFNAISGLEKNRTEPVRKERNEN